MSTGLVLLALRALLAAVFTAAAAAKLADRRALRETLVDFGLPRSVAGVAILVPAAELAVAVLLLPASTARPGALAGLALLALFTAAVAVQLARGHRPACNCFGATHARPIGPVTLVRNGALLACAAAVVAAGADDAGPSAVAWLRDGELAAIGALGLTAACLAAALVCVLRRHGQVLARLDELEAGTEPRRPGLPIGADAPWFEAHDLAGAPVTLTDLRAESLPLLLLFAHPGCGPCVSLLPEVGRWQRHLDDELVVALVSSGDVADVKVHAAEHGLTHVLLDDDGTVADAYEVTGTPTAVVVAPRGHVASAPAVGVLAIGALVAGLVEHAREEATAGV